MMRRMIWVPLAAAMAVAGCDGSADADGDGKISNEEAVAEAAGAVTPRPGQYETKVNLLELDVPETPGVDSAEMKKMLQGMLSSTTSHCMTAEDAQEATKQMLQGPASENCTYSKFDVSGGKVDAEMACKNPDGSSTTMQLSGTMGAEQSSMVMELDQALPGIPGGGKSHMKMQVDSRRTGDCTGGQSAS